MSESTVSSGGERAADANRAAVSLRRWAQLLRAGERSSAGATVCSLAASFASVGFGPGTASLALLAAALTETRGGLVTPLDGGCTLSDPVAPWERKDSLSDPFGDDVSVAVAVSVPPRVSPRPSRRSSRDATGPSKLDDCLGDSVCFMDSMGMDGVAGAWLGIVSGTGAAVRFAGDVTGGDAWAAGFLWAAVFLDTFV